MKEDLKALREQIDELDRALIGALSRRREAVIKVGEVKKMNGTEALDPKRWQEVLDSRMAWAKEVGLEESLVRNIFEEIHTWSLDIQAKNI